VSDARTRAPQAAGDPPAPCDDRGEPEIVVLADPGAVNREVARRIAAAARRAVGARGRADVATTGGSTPAGIYRALAGAPFDDETPWDRLHVWFGDDRFVPRTHRDSNVGPVDAVLHGGDGGRGSPLPAANVHPWPVEATLEAGGDAAVCAVAYAVEMRRAVPADAAGRPVFDAIVVGVGPDGHVLSVFPGSAAFDAAGWTAAVPAPTHIGPHVERVTCTPLVLAATPVLLAVAHGRSKAEAVARILAGPRDVRALPGQLARRAGATWLLDEAAAADLPVSVRAGATRANG
jgi:6-phosphogluconolactonase